MKYCVRGWVLLRHCSAEFIKQVLPKLLRPVAPFSVGSDGTNVKTDSVLAKENKIYNIYVNAKCAVSKKTYIADFAYLKDLQNPFLSKVTFSTTDNHLWK